jgi:CheY-like chemotaxis protein
VTSVVGQGSTFTLTARLSGSQGPAPRPAHDSLRGRSALIVDDNTTNRRVLSLQLAGWGMRCADAGSAADALAMIDGGDHYDIAVLDMHMPECDGAKLAARLRGRPDTAAMPLVLLTSVHWRPGPDQQALFDAVLTKPARAAVLHSRMEQALAAQRGVPTATTPAAAPTPTGTPLRVLLAEDNPVNQRVAQLMLKRLGHRVDTVGNGLEAVNAVSQIPYDVVLMDVQMPTMDGLEATRRIRADLPPDRQPPIFAMTASVLLEDKQECVRAGMNGYLPKPVRVDDLAASMATLTAAAPPPPEAGPPPPAATPPAPEAGRPQAPADALARETVLRQRLAELTGDDPDPEERELIAGLIGSFLDSALGWHANLAEAVEGGDRTEVNRQAHRFYGAASNLGATGLAGLLTTLEEESRTGTLDPGGPLLDRIRDEIEVTRSILTTISTELSPL